MSYKMMIIDDDEITLDLVQALMEDDYTIIKMKSGVQALAQLKEDNDAYYSQVTSAVDISEIKKKAIGELGMKYPSEDQIQTYTTEGNSYVRQYQDVDTHK